MGVEGTAGRGKAGYYGRRGGYRMMCSAVAPPPKQTGIRPVHTRFRKTLLSNQYHPIALAISDYAQEQTALLRLADSAMFPNFLAIGSLGAFSVIKGVLFCLNHIVFG
ncbi:hypothetical protein K440DRAFT_262281 [Wilcoxina mikolae CBS 423.85]|nr:hypothetical protein K440DRAFT_262281 [Wilcoxina mikolae CBS 423.85]